ncbi:thiol-disulfide oxidoreductase DCC family protein [Nocardiopsis sp. NPDC055551]|uniref:thiol-disulfide oxidoreductase DCC family protein n=1 Tax=Nocardiopsis sp. NPDC006832 TaxID=3157188 RepID=UPI0033D3DC63
MGHSRKSHRIPSAGLFLYDRDCGFCQRSVSFARERVRTRTAFAAWQETDLKAFGLTPEQADEQAWLVRSDRGLLAGGDAVAETLQFGRFPFRELGRLMALPGMRVLTRAAYRVIAANRYRLPGGGDTCALPPPRDG